jgi:hypothetical protein
MYLAGTSMATPIVAGLAALLREYLIKEMLIPSPSAALIKAGLVNGAIDISPGQYGSGTAREIPPGPPPNNVEGWGRADIDQSTYSGPNFTTLYYDENDSLNTGEHSEFQISVKGADAPFKANLVWTDYPGSVSANGSLVNDLDLQVIGPSSEVHYPDNALKNSSVSTITYNTFISISQSSTSKRALRFTPPQYPAYIDSAHFYHVNDLNIVQSVDIVVYSENGGTPGQELFRKTLTRVPSGLITVGLGLTILSGDFWISVEKGGSSTYLAVDNDGNPTGRSYFWNGSNWVPSTVTPYIWANVRGTDQSTSFDRVNNVLGLTLNSPGVGDYTVRVTGYNVPYGPQPFALVLSGNISETPVQPPETYTHTWLGKSTEWDSTSNWDAGSVPDTDAEALIPTTPADGNNFPLIGSGVNAAAKKLAVAGGPVVIQKDGILTLGS